MSEGYSPEPYPSEPYPPEPSAADPERAATADTVEPDLPADFGTSEPLGSLPAGELERLDPAYHTVELIGAWIFSAVAVMVLGVLALLAWLLVWLPEPWCFVALGAWPFVSIAICWFGHVYCGWEYERYRYRVTDDGIEIHKGVVWRSITSVPRSRVQHTDVTRGPLQRRFGIATLTIHTAGTQDASVELTGLTHEKALEVRDFLIQGGDDDGD